MLPLRYARFDRRLSLRMKLVSCFLSRVGQDNQDFFPDLMGVRQNLGPAKIARENAAILPPVFKGPGLPVRVSTPRAGSESCCPFSP